MKFETLFFGAYQVDDPESQNRDEVIKPWIFLREALERNHFEVKYLPNKEIVGDQDYLISASNIDKELLQKFVNIPKSNRFLLVFEPPVVSLSLHDPSLAEHFGKIFTLFDDQVDNVTYFKIQFPQPRLKMIEPIIDWEKKKFATMIANDLNSDHPNSLYEIRRGVIEFFENRRFKGFDLYGSSPSWTRYRCWKGKIKNKWPVLKEYKFCFSYENTQERPGYITEKIFDCFIAGCVPIYLGANNVKTYIPSDCFISREDFKDEEQLFRYLRKMDKNTYYNHIRAIDDFLNSDQAKLFSIEHFLEILMNHLEFPT